MVRLLVTMHNAHILRFHAREIEFGQQRMKLCDGGEFQGEYGRNGTANRPLAEHSSPVLTTRVALRPDTFFSLGLVHDW